MTDRLSTRHWAIIGAVVFTLVLLGANLHLVTVAIATQPECLPLVNSHAPARARC